MVSVLKVHGYFMFIGTVPLFAAIISLSFAVFAAASITGVLNLLIRKPEVKINAF
jgi:hypothetical protein